MRSERAGKWYDRAGNLVMEVPSADKKKMVKPTIKHARKLGLLPSVTSVIQDTLASYSILEYAKRQVALAALVTPKQPDQTDDDYIALLLAKSEEHKDACADIGKAIHGDIENAFESGKEPVNPVSARAYRSLCERLGGEQVVSEQPLYDASLGIAGTPDIYTPIRLIDMKTTDLSKFSEPHDSWKFQLGAYSNLLKRPDIILEQAVIDRNTGEVKYVPYETMGGVWGAAFEHLFEVWIAIKEYDPRKWQG